MGTARGQSFRAGKAHLCAAALVARAEGKALPRGKGDLGRGHEAGGEAQQIKLGRKLRRQGPGHAAGIRASIMPAYQLDPAGMASSSKS